VVKVLEARFSLSAVAPDGYPAPEVPEVAFVGRSNVGKSSMIEALTGRRKLVRVSKTPGRTRTINFFDVHLECDGTRSQLRLADMPGYGFARASKAERSGWEEMVTTYLRKRRTLKAVVSIVDGEVGPLAADFGMLDYLAVTAPGILVVATKIDRISRSKRAARGQQIAHQLELPPDRVVLFSSVERIGVQEVWDALLTSLGPPPRAQLS
jgi:GTP-binding protein